MRMSRLGLGRGDGIIFADVHNTVVLCRTEAELESITGV